MVRLYTSLLALALAAGSTLAFSDAYQRRSELYSDLYEREFVDNQETYFTREDLEDLFTRDSEVSNDFVAREPFGFLSLFKIGAKLIGKAVHSETAKRAVKHVAGNAVGQLQNRELELDEELFGRELDEELFERELDDEFFGREYDQLDERDIFDDL
ncbi:hypothetical protein BYT27DRAFT_7182402, partial [Phlegmacium glaucopus]